MNQFTQVVNVIVPLLGFEGMGAAYFNPPILTASGYSTILTIPTGMQEKMSLLKKVMSQLGKLPRFGRQKEARDLSIKALIERLRENGQPEIVLCIEFPFRLTNANLQEEESLQTHPRALTVEAVTNSKMIETELGSFKSQSGCWAFVVSLDGTAEIVGKRSPKRAILSTLEENKRRMHIEGGSDCSNSASEGKELTNILFHLPSSKNHLTNIPFVAFLDDHSDQFDSPERKSSSKKEHRLEDEELQLVNDMDRFGISNHLSRKEENPCSSNRSLQSEKSSNISNPPKSLHTRRSSRATPSSTRWSKAAPSSTRSRAQSFENDMPTTTPRHTNTTPPRSVPPHNPFKVREQLCKKFRILENKGNGDCVPRAIAQIFLDGENCHKLVRKQICQSLLHNAGHCLNSLPHGESVEDYVNRMALSGEWCGDREILAAALSYETPIVIYDVTHRQPLRYPSQDADPELLHMIDSRNELAYLLRDGNHYEAMYELGRSAMRQSMKDAPLGDTLTEGDESNNDDEGYDTVTEDNVDNIPTDNEGNDPANNQGDDGFSSTDDEGDGRKNENVYNLFV